MSVTVTLTDGTVVAVATGTDIRVDGNGGLSVLDDSTPRMLLGYWGAFAGPGASVVIDGSVVITTPATAEAPVEKANAK